jgi:hypothetical protein
LDLAGPCARPLFFQTLRLHPLATSFRVVRPLSVTEALAGAFCLGAISGCGEKTILSYISFASSANMPNPCYIFLTSLLDLKPGFMPGIFFLTAAEKYLIQGRINLR